MANNFDESTMNNIKNRAEEIVYNEIIYVQEDLKI